MKLETKIAYLILCLALPLTTACKKTPIPAEDPQPAEIGFTAASQAVWVKSGETSTPTFPHDDFGVWGIARQGNLVYNLWGNQSLTDVNKNTTTGYYEPEEAAYWMAGYTYNFLAVAPYNDAGFSFGEIKTKESQATATPAVANPVDCLTFTYDISDKYNKANYTFDLLGAAVQTGPIAGGRTESQEITFWHLLSHISFELKFGTDSKGQQIDGTVKAVSLSLKPEASFTILHNDESTQTTAPLHVEANATQTPAVSTPLTVTANAAIYNAGPINIVPQTPADLTLAIDFEIKESETSSVDYSMNIDLAAAQIPEKYLPNNRYNYRITIGTNASIAFEVTVNQDWEKVYDEIDMDNEE